MSAATYPLQAFPIRRVVVVATAMAATATLAVSALAHHDVRPTTSGQQPVASAQSGPTAPFGDDDYLKLSDRLLRLLEDRWSEREGRYRPGADLTETMVNANVLLVHAVAALHGHTGPARNDERARKVVQWLVDSPIWTEQVPTDHKQAHAPGWLAETGGWQQHLVIDAEVVDGLTYAYRARRALGLPSGRSR
jgi:hypothetical protein